MSGRTAPGFCPYCGEEDLWPVETPAAGPGASAAGPGGVIAQHGVRGAEPAGGGGTPPRAAWECRGCARVFSVRFLGLSATILEVPR